MSLDTEIARIVNLIQTMRYALDTDKLKGGQERQDTFHDIQALERLVGAVRKVEGPVVITEEATAEQILAGIDAWAKNLRDEIDNREALGPTDEQKEGERLWQILSALRGPDIEDHELKLRTTAVIRGAVLPNLADLGGAMVEEGVDWELLNRTLQLVRHSTPGQSAHFFVHARCAVYCLLENFDAFQYRKPA